MNTTKFIALCGLAALGVCASAQSNLQNLIRNGDFQNHTSAGWDDSGSYYVIDGDPTHYPCIGGWAVEAIDGFLHPTGQWYFGLNVPGGDPQAPGPFHHAAIHQQLIRPAYGSDFVAAQVSVRGSLFGKVLTAILWYTDGRPTLVKGFFYADSWQRWDLKPYLSPTRQLAAVEFSADSYGDEHYAGMGIDNVQFMVHPTLQ